MHADLKRGGIEVARCTVERLMHAKRLQGIRRHKTTQPDAAQTPRPPASSSASSPSRLWVADLHPRPLRLALCHGRHWAASSQQPQRAIPTCPQHRAARRSQAVAVTPTTMRGVRLVVQGRTAAHPAQAESR
ncbi:transposase [Kribbella sp. NPDC020789]